jgi:hypothetical protein
MAYAIEFDPEEELFKPNRLLIKKGHQGSLTFNTTKSYGIAASDEI